MMGTYAWNNRVAAIAVLVAITAAPPAAAVAQNSAKKLGEAQQQEAAAPAPVYSKEFRKVAGPIQQFANEKQWAEVLARLPEAEALPNLNRDEKVLLAGWRLQASQGVGDQEAFAAAIESFLREGLAQADQIGAMHRQLAAHYNNKKDRAKTLEHFRKFVDSTPDVEPDELDTLARLYRQNGEFSEASAWFGKAIDLTTARGDKPKEELFQLRDHCLLETKDTAGRLANLEALTSLYPDPKYYSNLVALYQEQSRDDRVVMLNVFRLAISDPDGGLATVGGYLTYADVALVSGSPGEAMRALERGIKDGVVPGVGTNQQLLQEAKAAVAADRRTLEAEAASAAKNGKGDVSVKVGLGYYSTGNFEKAAEMVRQGIAKGGVTRIDDANLLLGAALMELGRHDEAKAAFEAAATSTANANMGSIARLWLARATRDAAAPAGG